MGTLQRARATLDSWLNAITAVGGNLNRTAFAFARDAPVDDQTLEDLYHGDPFAARICKAVPEDALRQGFTVKTGDAALSSALAARLDDLRAREKALEAWVWARCFGGAALFVGADDGQPPWAPLDWGRIASVRFLTVLDKRELQADTWVTDPLARRFGEPEVYRVQRAPAGGGALDTHRVHASRLIRFDGALTSRRRRAQLGGWSESELGRVVEALRQFNAAYAAAGTLLQDSSQGVFKMKDLMSMLAQDKQDLFKTRMEAMDMARSVGRAILVDADGESFERVESGVLGGLPDVVDRFMLLLAGACEIPVTRLMGRAPAGLNATGESDTRGYYDRVQSDRTHMLRPRLEHLVRLLLRAQDGPTRGVEPAGWSVEFPSLWQMSPAEEAQLRNQVATTDVAYITAGVLTPEEVALSRFRAEGWNAETTVDLESRAAIRDADAAGSDEGDGLPATAGGAADPEGIMAVVERVGSRAIDRAAGIGLLTTTFGLTPEQAEAVMGRTGVDHFTTPPPDHAAVLADAQAQAAAAQRSARGAKQMLTRVLERNRAGELVVGRVITGKTPEGDEGDVLQEGDAVVVPAGSKDEETQP